MEKKCLILMPASDPEGYAKGHLNRVLQYIIVPACKSAGFSPVRAEDSASESITDVIKSVIASDIAICDISSKNATALHGFAIRQALNLPVVLLKDAKTKMAFEVQEFGGVEYDESLRIDTVESEIAMLSDALRKSSAKTDLHPLLGRLGITSGQKLEEIIPEPVDQPKERQLPLISPVPAYVADPITRQEDIDKLKPGDFLFHINYGKGEIKNIRKAARDKIADIRFETDSKHLVLVPTGVFRKIKAEG